MPILNLIVGLSWVVFVGYWIVSARTVKKDVVGSRRSWRSEAEMRIAATVVIVLVGVGLSKSGLLPKVSPMHSLGAVAETFGVFLCVCGIAFAIWARRHLGANWSGVPSMKEQHELVTSGPYRYVRHPIYTGIIMASLGSALVGGLIWIAVCAGAILIFIRRVKVEEQFMMQLFSDQYPQYMKKTKRLIPWVW